MKRLTAWTVAVAATAVFAGAGAVSAQQPSPTGEPQTSPPASTTPQSPQTPDTPQTPETPAPATPQAGGVDEEAVKRHLTAARDSLSELTQLPAAAQLTGETRTQVAQLITNFNELITTNLEWRASYAKVVNSLNTLMGEQRTDESPATPEAGTPGAVGTSGTVALDPAIRAKLTEFRAHLREFEKAAGGPSAASAASTSDSAPDSPAPSSSMPSNTTAPGSASEPPASVSSSAAAVSGATGTAGNAAESQQPAGTSGTTPAPSTDPAASKQEGHSEALRHIDAIEALLNGSAPQSAPGTATGTAGTSGGERATSFDRDQIAQIRAHLNELRRLLNQSSGR